MSANQKTASNTFVREASEEWPTPEMIREAEELCDDIDTIYYDDTPDLPIGVANQATDEIITLGKRYADYDAWRSLNDWSVVFDSPGYHGDSELDFQILCLPSFEQPWM